MRSKKPFITISVLALAATFALTGCGGVHSQGIQQAAGAHSTSVSANKFPAGNVVFDGTGYYQQAGVAKDDPINKVNPLTVDVATLKTFSEPEIQQAQQMAGKYIAEATDAPMRDPDYQSGILADHTPEMNKIESVYEAGLVSKYFASGYVIDDRAKPRDLSNTTDPMQGTGQYRNPGLDLTDVKVQNGNQYQKTAAFAYDYGKDKQRIASRTMTVTNVRADTIVTKSSLGNNAPDAREKEVGPSLGMQVDVAYSARALLSGQPLLINEHSIFSINFIRQDGKLVIDGVSVDEPKAP